MARPSSQPMPRCATSWCSTGSGSASGHCTRRPGSQVRPLLGRRRRVRRLTAPARLGHFEAPTETRADARLHAQKESHVSHLTRWLAPTTTAHAHCDIPCGIYDPHEAEIAARTVARMVELINGLEGDDTERAQQVQPAASGSRKTTPRRSSTRSRSSGPTTSSPSTSSRYPDLHDKVWKILKLAARTSRASMPRRPRSSRPRSRNSARSSGRPRSSAPAPTVRPGYRTPASDGVARERVRGPWRIAVAEAKHAARHRRRRLAAGRSDDRPLAAPRHGRRLPRAGRRRRSRSSVSRPARATGSPFADGYLELADDEAWLPQRCHAPR